MSQGFSFSSNILNFDKSCPIKLSQVTAEIIDHKSHTTFKNSTNNQFIKKLKSFSLDHLAKINVQLIHFMYLD